MKAPYWEHFEHEADIGVRGYGNTIAQSFEQAALAMSGVIVDLKSLAPRECFEVACNAPDNDILLVDWLNELIFHMATRKMLFASFDVNVTNHHLTATVCGEPANVAKHQPAVEIKGATFTELKVYQQSGKIWVAQCVIDV